MNDNNDERFSGEERRAPDRWKLNKEIGVVDLITIVSALVAVVYSYTTLDKRVTIVEGSIQLLAVSDGKQLEDARRLQDRVEKQIEIVNAKLDRLLERRER